MLRVRWQEMAAADARATYRATWDLSVPSAVAFLRERLRPASSPNPAGVPATDGPIAPREILRTLRAIAALERAGTPEAAAVLERMAPAEKRKGQALHGRVEADAANQSEIGSLSDVQFVVHADSKAPEKTAASAGPSQGDLSRSRWAAGPQRKGQALHGRVEAGAPSQSKIG
jgi:hypothetical protein